MRFTWKRLLLIAGVSAAACAFAACGKSADKESSAATAADATAETGAEAQKAPESYGSVKLGQYKGIDIEVSEVKVTDEELESYISGILSANPEETEVERPAAEGDVVNIDYSGTKDGVAFDGGTATGYDLKLGSGSFIDGFEDGLIGAVKGETRSLNLTFPSEYHQADLAGQAVVFEVKVNDVKESKETTLDDAWVEKYTEGAQKTVDEYKAAVRAQLTEQKEKRERSAELGSAIQKVMDASSFEIAPEALQYEMEQQRAGMEAQLAQYGMDLNSYLDRLSMSQEDYDKQVEQAGESAAKLRLLIDGIFDAEGFTLGDSDYKELEKQYGYSKSMLVSMAGQDAVDLETRYLKVANLILEKANKIPAAETEAESAADAGSTAETNAP